MGITSFEYNNDGHLEKITSVKYPRDNNKDLTYNKNNYNRIASIILTGNIIVMVFTLNPQTSTSVNQSNKQKIIYNTKELGEKQAEITHSKYNEIQKHIIPQTINKGVISKSLNYSPEYTGMNKTFQYGQDRTSYDIMEFKDLNKERNSMEQLIEHRQLAEKAGIITGVVLGLISMMIPILTGMNFSSILPATIMFLSLPSFMLLRKIIRRQLNG